MFKSKGIIRVPKEAMAEDGSWRSFWKRAAKTCRSQGDEFEITTAPDTFESVRQALEKVNVKATSSEISKVADNPVRVESENAAKVLRLVDALDELDDTQHVYSNFDISDEVLAKLEQSKNKG